METLTHDDMIWHKTWLWSYNPSHFKHYFNMKRLAYFTHMYMISKKSRALLIFRNPNKTDYTDDWYEVGGSFYEGKVPLSHLLTNNYNILSFLYLADITILLTNLGFSFKCLTRRRWFLRRIYTALGILRTSQICPR